MSTTMSTSKAPRAPKTSTAPDTLAQLDPILNRAADLASGVQATALGELLPLIRAAENFTICRRVVDDLERRADGGDPVSAKLCKDLRVTEASLESTGELLQGLFGVIGNIITRHVQECEALESVAYEARRVLSTGGAR